MRTTLALDDDVLLAAKQLAERQGSSLGAVISELARKGLSRPASRATQRNGLLLLSGRAGAKPVTMELVNQLRDELE